MRRPRPRRCREPPGRAERRKLPAGQSGKPLGSSNLVSWRHSNVCPQSGKKSSSFLTPFDFSSFTTIRSFFFHSRHQVILKCRCCFPESEKMRQRRRQWRRRRRRRWRHNFSQMSFNEVTKKSSASFFHTMKKLEKSRKKISRQFLDHRCCKNISCWSSNLVGLP